MLERIRENSQGVVVKIILGLIILTFALAGVGSYISASGQVPAATVNGEEISNATFERAYQNERARMEQQLGEFFSQLASNPDYMSNFRNGVLDRLIAEELADQLAEELGLRASDEQVKESIRNMPEFQLDGRFNNDRYLAVLRQAGFQPTGFRDYMRGEITRRQLLNAVMGTEFSLDSEIVNFASLQDQTRDFKFITVEALPFEASIEVSDEELQSYYEENISKYDTQEKISLEYVEIKAEDLLADVTLEDGEVEQYYQDNIDSYKTAEQRRVSHILVEFGEDETAARAKIDEAKTKLNSGEDFAELAKTYSEDTFSAENGGDLEYLERGIMDPIFDDTAFSLAAAGDVSDVIKTEFGFHILKLTELTAEVIKPLDEVQGEIETALKANHASELFYEMQTKLTEISFEVPDSLIDAAASIDKEVKTTKLFTRFTAPAPLNNPAVMSVAFDDQVLVEKLNSDVIEVGEEHALVIRLKDHEPVRTQSLEEVTQQVKSAVIAKKASEKAQALAKELRESLVAGDSVEELLKENDLSWEEKTAVTRTSTDISREIVSKAFKMAMPSDEQQTSYDIAELSNGDRAVLQLTKITSGELSDDNKANYQQRLVSSASQAIYQQMIEALKQTASIEKYATDAPTTM